MTQTKQSYIWTIITSTKLLSLLRKWNVGAINEHLYVKLKMIRLVSLKSYVVLCRILIRQIFNVLPDKTFFYIEIYMHISLCIYYTLFLCVRNVFIILKSSSCFFFIYTCQKDNHVKYNSFNFIFTFYMNAIRNTKNTRNLISKYVETNLKSWNFCFT